MGGWVGVRWERREGAVGAVGARWGAGRLVWFRGEALLVLLGRLIGGSEVGGREVSLVKAGGSFGSLGAFYGSSGKGLWFFERLLWFIGRCFGSLGGLILNTSCCFESLGLDNATPLAVFKAVLQESANPPAAVKPRAG